MLGMTKTQILLQNKYENARHSVVKAYEIAAKNFAYAEAPRKYTKNEKGEMVRDWSNETDPTFEQNMAHYIKSAHLIAVELNKDLDATLSVLDAAEEASNEGIKATHS